MNKTILFCFCLCSSLIGIAQNNNSPYSVIGIGDIDNSFYDRTAGMANTGVALWSKRNLIQNNPAAYVHLEDVPFKTGFNIELAANYNDVSYAGKPVTNSTDNQSTDLQFKKICFAIKLRPKWALSFGMLPYSNSNYSFYEAKQVAGGGFSVPSYIQGSGNVSQLYSANSFAINKHLSFGVHAAMLFGQFSQVETIIGSSISDSSLVTTRNYSVHAPYVKFGLQYNTDITPSWNIALGSTVALQANLSGIYDLNVESGNTAIKTSETDINNYFTIPVSYNNGAAITYNDRFTLAADYSYQPWTNTNHSGLGYTLTNSQRYSIGGQYANKIKFPSGITVEKFFLQAGFYYSDSYLKVYGNQISDIGGSIGAGFNSLKTGIGLSAALLVGSKGTTTQNLVKENYTQFNLTISYRDFWFTAKKKYD